MADQPKGRTKALSPAAGKAAAAKNSASTAPRRGRSEKKPAQPAIAEEPKASVAPPAPVSAAAKAAPVRKAVKGNVAIAKSVAPHKEDPSAINAAAKPQGPAQQGTEHMADTMNQTQNNAEKAFSTAQAAGNEAKDRMQAVFGDLNERSKAAVEKGSKLFEEMNDIAKGNVEALVESGKIAAKGAEEFGQDAAEASRRYFENATQAMKRFASVKSPSEFFQLQSEYVRSAFDSMVSDSSKHSEAALKLAGDIAQPISNRFSVVSEKVKTLNA